MIDYLSSKVAEYSVVFNFLEAKIDYLKSNLDHREIITHFEKEIQEL